MTTRRSYRREINLLRERLAAVESERAALNTAISALEALEAPGTPPRTVEDFILQIVGDEPMPAVEIHTALVQAGRYSSLRQSQSCVNHRLRRMMLKGYLRQPSRGYYAKGGANGRQEEEGLLNQ